MDPTAAREAFAPPDAFDATVVVYGTRFCGYCRMAERLLRQRQIPFEAVDVTRSPDARSWLRTTTGQRTVPQIFIHGESIGGYVELAAMDRSGQLAEALTP